MTTAQFITLVGMLVAGFAATIWLVLRSRGASQMLQRTDALQAALDAAFTKANADMAARVEQVRGDLRTDLTERLQQGLNLVRETVDRQLAQGRAEQTAALTEARKETATALAALGSGLQAKFDQLAESQAQAARQARGELAQSLTEATRALQQRFEALEQRTSANLEAIRAKVDDKLQAISDQVQVKLEKNIQEGFAHFQRVQEHLQKAEEQLRNVGVVGQSINELNNLLKLPHLRGQFGEAELSRLLADFLPAGAFEEQAVIVPGSRERVDAVINFPKFRLPVDSKFNREQILPLFQTNDPQQLEEARRQLGTVIRQQARDIADKYIHPEHGTTDLAFMFLPSETVYFEVLRDTELCDALHRLKVFPVSPNTLAITLRTVAMSISQFEFAKNVEQTLEQIRAAQTHFGHFQKKFEEVGRGLEKAQEAYGTATGHLNRFAQRVVRLTGEPAPELDSQRAVDASLPAAEGANQDQQS
jgi:DNA recombination protein RmuC